MKAVVLAGGYATRLWPITRNRPKMFLPVGETTVIDRVLSELEDDDRIDDVFVSTNERFADDFEAHLAETAFEKPQLSVEETVDEDEKLGVIGALAQLVDREDIDDEDLLVVAGDNLISFDLSTFVDFFEEEETATLAAYDVGSREKATQYGLVELDGTRVVDFQEKPADPPSTLVSIACYAFPAEEVRFSEYLAADNNPDEPGWFVQWLQSRSPVSAFTFEEAWFDIGTPESYLEAVAWALDGDSIVAEDATVEDTTIGENVHVMPGATVTDATLERSLVFPDATLESCSLVDSIVDREALVRNLDLTGARIGGHTHLP
ncbi:glucose-1-phosphate thymidylyltransferase [Halovenus aranensis]|jgi:glucose-1-phosphate thymidylyltransferase|uniref:Glucose-1-phosphate thymidylyltransferase n=1 Tax=Halovenus aranensis TaxID=890420 RepID=A0A1G8VPW5_9EURY|nr:NDP-sugar synthase [Halovenus aranensis]SDJ67984.1 glucose-1-phosphate thymidylyltransferase [Halovenus aranensis]